MAPRFRARPSFLAGSVLALLVIGLPPLVPEASGQYFGRNKVRYQTYDFQILETDHFDLYHYEQERDAALMSGRMAERWYARISRLLDYDFRDRQPFILYANSPAFRQTTAIPGQVGEGTGGVTEPLKRRIVLPMAGPLVDTDHVIGHELVHGFQYAMTGIDPSSPLFGTPRISGLPLWMIEGMAEYLSRGPVNVNTAMAVRDGMQREDSLPTVDDLANSRKWFPYTWGHALWAYIGGRWGDDKVRELQQAALQRGSVNGAIQAVLGVSPDTLSMDWHRAIREAYGPVRERTRGAGDLATALLTGDDRGVTYNVSPALSPDGSRIMFLSSRGRFSIEMYLADAETGEVIRQVTQTVLDPHFQSLQFLHSAGAWSPDGERFAFIAISKANPVLVVIDASSGERLREVRLPDLGEAFNPTWSPDGGRIALVGNDGGFLDLFVVDLESGQRRRLTEDAFSELHPAWSPDGGRIAFATDRFTTDLGTLDIGPYQLATIDPESGRVSRLASFEGAKNINPQWGPGGELYFVSDRGGISNVYRLDPASGEMTRVTDLFTGASGITPLSPAISVARSSGRLAFTLLDRGNHDIYRMDAGQVASADVPLELAGFGDPAALPPQGRRESRVAALMDDSRLGLPDPVTFQTRDYDAGLGLDYIAQPSLGLGISSFGSFIGGGAALYWSDMLGYHSLATILQAQIIDGEVLNGLGGLAQYLNRKNRLYWGFVAGQVPLFSRGLTRPVGQDTDGDGAVDRILQSELRFWEIQRPALGIVQYPFSEVFRAEFSGGFQQTDFDVELDSLIFTRTERREESVDIPACGDSLSFRRTLCEPGSMNQGLASAALVFDNSIAAPTGPILGQRFRLEASPSLGTLSYFTALGDLRKYVMPFSPVTLAGRVLHYGRYGGDANDDRLQRLFLGYPSLVRGYDSGSFDIRNCPSRFLEQCAQDLETLFDDLFGTRLAVANVEARIPVFGPLGLFGGGPVPPIDLFGFGDAGVAWTSDQEASFLGGERSWLTSAGAGLRANLFGFAIGELVWVHPFDRPDRDSYVTFYLKPAF